MQQPIPGDVYGKAQLLMKIKGDGALVHANMKARETRDEDYLVYWQSIATQIESLMASGHG